jgi:hypothetical protein
VANGTRINRDQRLTRPPDVWRRERYEQRDGDQADENHGPLPPVTPGWLAAGGGLILDVLSNSTFELEN